MGSCCTHPSSSPRMAGNRRADTSPIHPERESENAKEVLSLPIIKPRRRKTNPNVVERGDVDRDRKTKDTTNINQSPRAEQDLYKHISNGQLPWCPPDEENAAVIPFANIVSKEEEEYECRSHVSSLHVLPNRFNPSALSTQSSLHSSLSQPLFGDNEASMHANMVIPHIASHSALSNDFPSRKHKQLCFADEDVATHPNRISSHPSQTSLATSTSDERGRYSLNLRKHTLPSLHSTSSLEMRRLSSGLNEENVSTQKLSHNVYPPSTASYRVPTLKPIHALNSSSNRILNPSHLSEAGNNMMYSQQSDLNPESPSHSAVSSRSHGIATELGSHTDPRRKYSQVTSLSDYLAPSTQQSPFHSTGSILQGDSESPIRRHSLIPVPAIPTFKVQLPNHLDPVARSDNESLSGIGTRSTVSSSHGLRIRKKKRQEIVNDFLPTNARFADNVYVGDIQNPKVHIAGRPGNATSNSSLPMLVSSYDSLHGHLQVQRQQSDLYSPQQASSSSSLTRPSRNSQMRDFETWMSHRQAYQDKF